MLLIADGDKVTLGTPVVDGARVVATAAGEGRGKKIVVFKYKRKARYSKKTGHRQSYTRLSIDRIVEAGKEEPAKKARRRKKEVTESGA